MKLRLHLALVATIACAALPTVAADSALPSPKPRVAVGAEEQWTLRQPEPVKALFTSAEETPRRAIRIVYPPLIEPR